jgi:exonuclease SbcC
MRPRRLELDGFGSFREPTVIDLTDADYFVLVGATGSGKSTVIDAICFALYGSVPRYEHKGLVAPVVSHGKLRARVRLDFSLGEAEYTAVRVVRRTKTGASTPEARLECAGEVLAGTADELTDAAARLIGLDFDHFCKCVVLPQGEFSRFLHDKPSERGELVTKLLNLGIYDRMREAASGRAARMRGECEGMESRLGDLSWATTEVLDEAQTRLDRLRALQETVSSTSDELHKLATAALEARTAERQARSWIALLAGLEAPEGITELGRVTAEARLALDDAKAQAAAAEAALEEAGSIRAALGDRAPLAAAIEERRRRDELEASIAATGPALAEASQLERTALADHHSARGACEAAGRAEAKLRDAHAAHHLASRLHVGDSCPVCEQEVSKLPTLEVPADLEEARMAVTEAVEQLEKTAGVLQRARETLTGVQTQRKVLEDLASTLDERLRAYPDAGEVLSALEAVDAAEAALLDARVADNEARQAERSAREALEEAVTAEKGARREFERSREALIPLGPPSPSDDLATDWAALTSWAGTRSAELGSAAAASESEAEEMDKRRTVLIEDLERACLDCEVDHLGGRFHEAVVEAAAEAGAELKVARVAAEEAAGLRVRLDKRRKEEQLASAMALYLSGHQGRFKPWIINEALRRLVEGANRVLLELSGEQYSLGVAGSGSFVVTDHFNASETRSARTLSGGETFLASLALALALSDQLAELAAEGAARLDAIFLDEGFGTLDPDTLDVVAETVDKLAAQGRMVGIVTHVRELAERVPLQLRVNKNEKTSTVETVPA